MPRITVFNQKGGVGKTTTALNLAAALARASEAPLVIDLDPQAHLSGLSGLDVATSGASIGPTEAMPSVAVWYRRVITLPP